MCKMLLITIAITKIYPQEIRVALCEGNTKNRGVGLSQSCGQQAQLSLMVIFLRQKLYCVNISCSSFMQLNLLELSVCL